MSEYQRQAPIGAADALNQLHQEHPCRFTPQIYRPYRGLNDATVVRGFPSVTPGYNLPALSDLIHIQSAQSMAGRFCFQTSRLGFHLRVSTSTILRLGDSLRYKPIY
jgi:hypothetical protein